MPAVVSDTSVLHYLSVTGQFGCLEKLFDGVFIPPAVWWEVRARKQGLLPQLKPLLDELIATHRFRFDKNLYAQTLREVHESE